MLPHPSFTLLLILGIGSLSLSSCGERGEAIPVACLEGPAFYAQGDGGETRISDCLVPNQSGGELATVGAAMVAAATELNREARAEPGGEANRQLGYLVGAAERGAGGTEGIHADLLRRLRAAALYSPAGRSPSAAFLSAYRRGEESGRSQG